MLRCFLLRMENVEGKSVFMHKEQHSLKPPPPRFHRFKMHPGHTASSVPGSWEAAASRRLSPSLWPNPSASASPAPDNPSPLRQHLQEEQKRAQLRRTRVQARVWRGSTLTRGQVNVEGSVGGQQGALHQRGVFLTSCQGCRQMHRRLRLSNHGVQQSRWRMTDLAGCGDGTTGGFSCSDRHSTECLRGRSKLSELIQNNLISGQMLEAGPHPY